jgi:hypothetical protein
MFFRKQNYIFIAIALSFVAYLFLPLTKLTIGTELPCTITPFGINGIEFTKYNYLFWLFAGVVILLVLCCIATIICFKKRKVQLKLTILACFLNLLIIGGEFWLVDFFTKTLVPDATTAAHYAFAIYIPIVTFVLLMMAQRGIRQDEAKVKSYERIR